VAARNQFILISTQLGNQIRGTMKTFGLIVPRGKGGAFENNVRNLLDGEEGLARIMLPLLEAWRDVSLSTFSAWRASMRIAGRPLAANV
jgi:transposase